MKILQTILCVMFLASSGCGPALSRPTRDRVTYTGSFRLLAANPSAFLGEVVLFGGKILETHASDEGSEMTVLQMPLDSWNRPVDPDRSEGRYVLKTGEFMDPEIFKKDRPVTVAGTMTGVRKGLIENYEYGYPVIEILEIKAWEDSGAAFPQIYFGIGVGTWF